MTEKAKRKGNPCKLWLLHIFLLIVMIAIVPSSAATAQDVSSRDMILYTVNNNNGGGISVYGFDIADPDTIIDYLSNQLIYPNSIHPIRDTASVIYVQWNTDASAPNDIMILDTITGETQQVGICDCAFALIDDSQTWLAVVERAAVNTYTLARVVVVNLETSERRIIHDITLGTEHNGGIQFTWLPDTSMLRFYAESEPYQWQLMDYDTETDTITRLDSWENDLPVTLSPLGDAIFAWEDRLISVADIHTPIAIEEIGINPQASHTLYSRSFRMWHPSEGTVLMEDRWYNPENEQYYSSHTVLNWQTDDIEAMIQTEPPTYMLGDIAFNAEGSWMLYDVFDPQTGRTDTVLRDMQTDEETVIPIEGDHPIFVGG